MRPTLLLAACFLAASMAAAQSSSAPTQTDGVTRLIGAVQQAIQSGDAAGLRALVRPDAEAGPVDEFVDAMTSPPATGVTVKERDRMPLTGGRQRVLLEILVEHDRQGLVSTWRVDVVPPTGAAPETPWQIAHIEKLTIVSGLYRLALDSGSEFDVRNLVIQEPDLTLRVPAGRAFVARAGGRPTALVLLGHGTIEFSPRPEAERGQVRTFCGADALTTSFQTIFVRLNPEVYSTRVAPAALTPRPVDRGDLGKAQEVFETNVPLSFQVDIGDLSTERWSLLPMGDDMVAEIGTKKYGTLTYALASSEPEDISFFDRRHKKNISIYASEAKLAAHGRFFSDDDGEDYDVRRYDVKAAFSPDRLWVDGRTRISLRTKTALAGTLTLRLADPLVVRSVSSPLFGRLLFLRIVGQNSFLVSFPSMLPAGTDVDLDVVYGGRLQPQGLDRETLTVQQDPYGQDTIVMPIEPQYVYSNRSFWYPQAMTTDYATAKLTIAVPPEFDVIASGTPEAPTNITVDPGRQPRKQFVFETDRPARYLACIISRFDGMQSARLTLPLAEEGRSAARASLTDGGGEEDEVPPFNLFVQATPRQVNRTRAFTEKTAEVLQFYTSILADVPYASFTVALTESDLPGGHSPAYFAIVNQPLPTSPYTWRNDPVAFQNYPTFFLAHEVAHQWWGQAVGWKNYHEQWLSEGFAQYFAAMYAERERGADEFTSILRQMRKTAMDTSSNGPVYLGYRLGHLKGDSRIFRALVYNKGAMVLHMLRRLVGDQAFFTGIREFYTTWRYKKAGTEDFRLAMEAASGQSLSRFFDRWIYGSSLPSLRFTSRVEGQQLHVAFEQKTPDVFDVPVTVTVTYANGSTEDVVVRVTERRTEQIIPLKRAVRDVDVNRDGAALADIDR